MVATSTEIWNVKRVLSRSSTRAETGWVTFATCWAQASLGRTVSKTAPPVSAPTANLPAPLMNPRRSMCPCRPAEKSDAFLRSMIAAPQVTWPTVFGRREDVGHRPPVGVVRHRCARALDAGAGEAVVQRDDAVRVGTGQRAEQHRADDREDGRVGAKAD